MATQSANSSKKAESHESPNARDATCAAGRDATHDKTHATRDETSARPGEVGTKPGDEGSPKAPSAEAEALDDALEDPYDNVACTD